MDHFHSMKWREAQRFTDRFISLIPSRIQALEQAVQSCAGFAGWTASGSETSLESLGRWVVSAVPIRSGTLADLEHSPAPIFSSRVPRSIVESMTARIPPTWAFVDRDTAFSIIVDVGMYFGESLRREYRGLTWGRQKAKTNTYNSPALLYRDGSACFSPTTQSHNILTGILDERRSTSAFADLYRLYMDKFHGLMNASGRRLLVDPDLAPKQ